MIKADLPEGEAFLLRLPDGTEIFIHQNVWERRLSIKMTCDYGRRMRTQWYPASIQELARETVLVEVQS